MFISIDIIVFITHVFEVETTTKSHVTCQECRDVTPPPKFHSSQQITVLNARNA